MRVLVTASRSWDDAKTIRDTLESLAESFAASDVEQMVVVHGACQHGGDEIADQWVRHYLGPIRVTAERHPALWRRYGNRAGVVRNEIMISRGADVCLAFIRDDSPGATHCAELASDVGIPLRVWRYGEPGVTSMDSRHLADEDVM